jgi:hypothetical protein
MQPATDGAFQRGVDLGEQSPDPVADLGDLGGKVVIETAEPSQTRLPPASPEIWETRCRGLAVANAERTYILNELAVLTKGLEA